MSKTLYERRRAVAKDVAVEKTKSIGGSHSFSFGYRGSDVWVTATKKGRQIKVHTDSVANKGK